MNKETQTYILTQDTFAATKKLTGREISTRLEEAIDVYFNSISKTVSDAFCDADISIKSFSESLIEKGLETKVKSELRGDPNAIAICFDRFLLEKIENEFPERFARLQITRTVDGEKTSRQGQLPLASQLDELADLLKGKNIILIDDGIFSGGTVMYVISELQKREIERFRVKKFIGFITDGQKIEDLEVDTIETVTSMFDWIDIRDFSLFGGKKFEQSRNNRVSTSIPYIFPWSGGKSASLDKQEKFYDVSKSMILAFKKLIESIEKEAGKIFTIKDFVKAGYSIPTDKDKQIPINLNSSITKYLDNCMTIVDAKLYKK